MIDASKTKTGFFPREIRRSQTAPTVLLGEIIRCIFLTISGLIVLFPFLWMFFAAFKTEEAVFAQTFTLLPTQWVFTNFVDAWNAAPFANFTANSVVVALITVGCQLLTCSLAAYAFAKIDFTLKKTLFTIIMVTMMVPDEAAIISNYLLVKNMGLVNTHLGIAITSLTSVFGIFLLRQTFMTIPNDLFNSAKLDGCGEIRAFFSIALPNASSALATLALLGFMGSWNAYMWPYIVTSSNTMRTLQIGLKYMVSPDLGPEWPKIMAASTMILLPVILLFVFLQKYFVAGMIKSGIK